VAKKVAQKKQARNPHRGDEGILGGKSLSCWEGGSYEDIKLMPAEV